MATEPETKVATPLIVFTTALIALHTATLEIMIDRGLISAEDARSRLAKIQDELARSDAGLASAAVIENVSSTLAAMYGLPQGPPN